MSKDKEGVEFWQEHFSTADKADAAAFAEKLATHFRKEIDPLIVYKIVDHVIGKDDGDGGEEWITLEQWEAFLAKFGPFAECMQHTKASMIDKEGNIQPWFHGHISRDNAATFFLQEAGYFLVRYGSQESDRDKLVMSYARIKDEDGKRAFVTKSTYIVIDPKKGYHMSSDSDGDKFWYPTLPQMFAERWVGLLAVPSKLYSKFAVHGKAASTSYSYYGDKDKKGGGAEQPVPKYQKRPLQKYGYTRHTAGGDGASAGGGGGGGGGGARAPAPSTVSSANHYAHYTGDAAASTAHATPAPAAKAAAPAHAAPGAMYAAYNDAAPAAAAKASGGHGPAPAAAAASSGGGGGHLSNMARGLIAGAGLAERGGTLPMPASHVSHSGESNYAAYGMEADGKHPPLGAHRGSGSGKADMYADYDHGASTKDVHKGKDKDKGKPVAKAAPQAAQPNATYASYDMNAPAAHHPVQRVTSTPPVRGKQTPAESNYQTYEEATTTPARNQTFAGTSHGPVHTDKASTASSTYHTYTGNKR